MACILGTAQAVGLNLALFPLPQLNFWDLKAHMPASTQDMTLRPSQGFCLSRPDSTAPISLQFWGSTLTTSLWVPLRFAAGGVWTTAIPPFLLHTQCCPQWRNILPQWIQASQPAVSPFSQRIEKSRAAYAPLPSSISWRQPKGQSHLVILS